MTQLLDEGLKKQATPPAVARVGRDERAGRLPVVIALVLSLIACGLTRQWAADWKIAHSNTQTGAGAHGALGGMDSYALALMLGGLRGPLVMVLWSKVESQKIDRDLEDVDSMIEWIRLLQPEFDTVHIFQIWNKAYNISVLMASTASKYTTILDAVDYARRVDADRPGDLNINDALSQVFADKLGGKNVAERTFYRRQLREDTLTDDNRIKAYPEDRNTYRRLGLKYLSIESGPLLDEQNNLPARLARARFARPADLSEASEWNDGAELQYLRKYQPFPYGISPSAMGYNYAKRAQVAMTVGGQRPLQISDTVIDSRPGLILKQWSEEESDRGVTYEAQAFGLPHDAEPHELEGPTAKVSPAQKVADGHAMDAAIYSYRLSARLCADATAEYHRHLKNREFVNQYQDYASHLSELQALGALSAGDAEYLEAFQGGDGKTGALADAKNHYLEARRLYQLIILKYFTEAAVADPMYRAKNVPLNDLSAEQVDQLYAQVMDAVRRLAAEFHEYDDHRADYLAYIDRADVRLHLLGGRSILQVP